MRVKAGKRLKTPKTLTAIIPASIRRRFIVPAVTAFVSFAFGGFYFALLPSIVVEGLGQKNLAVGGAIVFELCAVAGAVMLVTRGLGSRIAMRGGLVMLLPSLAALILAQALKSMPTLLIGTALGAVAMALGYRGSLQVVNEIAPDDRRGEVVSAYFVAGFLGNSVPVIGVGCVAALSNALIASVTFACAIAAFVVAALIAGSRCEIAPRRGDGAGVTR